VSEENEGAESGPQGAGVDADAVALGAAMARASGAVDRELIAYLGDQRRHLHEQFKHLAEQYKQLRLATWEKRLGVLLRIATAFMGLAIAAGLAFLIWNAASSNDLVIDSFQVPPDLADRGLSGPVVAAKLSDKIAAMQAQTLSQRAPKSYANGLPDGLKLNIPETGVSLSELDRFLREKLGHDLHIGGEMVQAGTGIALTARVGTGGSATVAGAEADTDALLQKLAEQIYRITQPYSFSVWLGPHGRNEERDAILRQLAASGPPGERAWAYNGLGTSALPRQGQEAGNKFYRRGLALDPNNYLLAQNIGATEHILGREEDGARDIAKALAAVEAHGQDYTLPGRINGLIHTYRAQLLWHQGAMLEALQQWRVSTSEAISAGAVISRIFSTQAVGLAGLHEPGAARATLADPSADPKLATLGNYVEEIFIARLAVALEAQDWPGALAIDRDFAASAALYLGFAVDKPAVIDPSIALAEAHLGHFADAEARLKSTPGDCYPCLIMRAQVAALQKQDARADFWFARAAGAAPSAPFAETKWGQALLARGAPDTAIEKFKLANQIGPHFADPLEGWGEALMAKNHSDRAIIKFAEAEKYAPIWGRLHLKWGEALGYAGKPDEAKAQFARAAALDLTPSEKSELTRAGTHV
jgi:tetratricopeptide (TPR) repeat protein